MNPIAYGSVIIAALAVLSGCGNEPMERQVSKNGTESGLIAVVDDCRIWRVQDGNRETVYFARCPEGSAPVNWEVTRSSGKTTYTVDKQTLGD